MELNCCCINHKQNNQSSQQINQNTKAIWWRTNVSQKHQRAVELLIKMSKQKQLDAVPDKKAEDREGTLQKQTQQKALTSLDAKGFCGTKEQLFQTQKTHHEIVICFSVLGQHPASTTTPETKTNATNTVDFFQYCWTWQCWRATLLNKKLAQ